MSDQHRLPRNDRRDERPADLEAVAAPAGVSPAVHRIQQLTGLTPEQIKTIYTRAVIAELRTRLAETTPADEALAS